MNQISKIQKIQSIKESHIIKEYDSTVLCHGHFNIIHPGHQRFLKHAKSLGSKLVIGIHSDNYFINRKRTNFYTQALRAETVATISSVDYVIPFENEYDSIKLVRLLKPTAYILGREFEYERRDEVSNLIDICIKIGCKVVFHAGDIQYSNPDIFLRSHSQLKEERSKEFRDVCNKLEYTLTDITDCIVQFQNSKILVLGDTIIDQYVACDALGMSSEAPVLVVKELSSKKYVGGAAIIAAHINELGAECHYMSVVGTDDSSTYLQKELNRLNISSSLFNDESRPTTFKIRYMVDNQKLFRVSKLSENTISETLENKIIERLIEIVPKYSAILIADFVYGVVTDKIISTLQTLAKKYEIPLLGDLQCSSQVGNVTKFRNFNLICPTEKEARIAVDSKSNSLEWLANKLMAITNSPNLLLKLGSKGFIAYETDIASGFVKRQHFPALETNPIDVTGAGDALIACMSVCLGAGASLMQSSIISNCMASIAVSNIGNVPISKTELLLFIKNQLIVN